MNICKNLGQDIQNSTSAFQPHLATHIALDTNHHFLPLPLLFIMTSVYFAFSKCAVRVPVFLWAQFQLEAAREHNNVCVSVLQLRLLPTLPSDYFSSICDTPCQGISTSRRPWCSPNLLSLKTETPVSPSMSVTRSGHHPRLPSAPQSPKDHVSIIRLGSGYQKKQVRANHSCSS